MSNDVAGRMLGWSLGALARDRPERGRIHDLVSFPCTFCFKAVGRAALDNTSGNSGNNEDSGDNGDNGHNGDDNERHGFVAMLLARVARVLGRDVADDEHTVRKSAQGTYESVTLNLWVTSGDEVYSIYAALGDDERVKYLL